MSETRTTTQALVIGSGIAGASCALTIAEQGYDVILLNAGEELNDGNTAFAQGGIVTQGQNDSPEALSKDIRNAGWNYNHSPAVNHLARKGPDAVNHILINRLGIPFARKKDNSSFDMTREGGHTTARVLYCGDFTGREIMNGLKTAVLSTPNINVRSGRTAVDLITNHHHTTKISFRYSRKNQCLGAYVYNNDTGDVETILADYTVLATGGLGRIFLHSTNAECAVGSGITMAHRAGARLMNTEFMQFHPTALYHRSKRRFLITEAMRGEGALLIDGNGKRFMEQYDPRMELAPRDIVSQAIVDTMQRNEDECVFLDCRTVNHDLHERFPTIHKHCMDLDIDITKTPIPVVPAAHYHCGGIYSDLNGRSSLDRLFAIGECSCTGVHGANRLASTSLLEGVLWGRSSGDYIARKLSQNAKANKRLQNSIPDWLHSGQVLNEDPALIAQDWMSIRSTMWNYAGINRTPQRLARAGEDLRVLIRDITQFYKRTPISKPIIDLFHGCYASYIVTMAALANKTSIGCHALQDD
ncbi:FAD-dependent oxidoreductase [Pseudodesulfovibrio sp. zrk46]|uniref:L-aspartate oxidase n=1 Tax=Pseudodesulfovibrio sp. zrk46 TaxID=2725288 RepID=UPI00144908CE|nr:FAD-dependent oxidoreductase [Pseudodesulfovibrio sp. zrk46]QJB57427.1 FAD-dependent oxidoreductase [Pseudodesulfovibrio sp. zrk46]